MAWAAVACQSPAASGPGSAGTGAPPEPGTSLSPGESLLPGFTLPPGASSPVAAAGKVSMTLEPGWTEISMEPAAIQAQITALASTSPSTSDALRQLLQTGQYRNILLYGLGSGPAGPIGSVTITTYAPGPIELDALVPLLQGQLASQGGSGFSTTHVVLPAGSAVRFEYTLALGAGSTATTVGGRAYIVSRGGRVYQVTFTCRSESLGPCFAASDRMIQTFRIET